MRHTPGPHHVGGGKFKNERPLGDEHFAIFNRSCACLAHVFKEGDAHLYAAASEMFELLVRLVSAKGPQPFHEAREEARALLHRIEEGE